MLIFHVDCNFARYPTEYLRTWLHRLADLGYDTILWELEDKVQWETCPECVWPEAMSKAEFRSLLAEARALGMENIPLLQTIGHAEYVLKHEPYLAWREDPSRHDCYCTSNPQVRTFLKRWIAEIVDLFGELTYFHLGGDEAYRFGTCPTCSSRAEEIGRNALYAEHILDLAQPLLKAGIRPGIWCDMILHHPDQMGAIPPEFVIWDWNYWSTDEAPERIRVWNMGVIGKDDVTPELLAQIPELLDANGDFSPFYTADMMTRLGYEVILCSATRSHGDSVYCGQHDAHAGNVIGVSRKAKQANLLGSCVTSWAIRIHNFETQWAWIAMAALAVEKPELSRQEIERQTCTALTGADDAESLCSAMAQIGKAVPFAAMNETGIQWDSLKDFAPAPSTWVADRLHAWKQGDDESIARQVKRAEDAIVSISEGMATLNHLIARSTGAHELLNAWSRAARLQLWSARLALEVLAKAQGEAIDRDGVIATHRALKREFQAWAEEWLTPRCAQTTADLVCDAVGTYLRQ